MKAIRYCPTIRILIIIGIRIVKEKKREGMGELNETEREWYDKHRSRREGGRKVIIKKRVEKGITSYTCHNF